MTNQNKYPLISGNLSLDLVNTEVIRHGNRLDLLLSEQDLIEWIHTLKVNTTHSFWQDELFLKINDEKKKVLSSIRNMRDILRENFEVIADKGIISGDFVSYLEKKVEKAPFTYKFVNESLIPCPVGEIDDIILSFISFDVLTLIEQNELNKMKRCANEECVLLFIDQSGRRKWCSMKICGNRKKVKRFQQKNENDL